MFVLFDRCLMTIYSTSQYFPLIFIQISFYIVGTPGHQAFRNYIHLCCCVIMQTIRYEIILIPNSLNCDKWIYNVTSCHHLVLVSDIHVDKYTNIQQCKRSCIKMYVIRNFYSHFTFRNVKQPSSFLQTLNIQNVHA
jgi:hypothetical protein